MKLETACSASYINTVKQNIYVGHINLLACGQTPYRWVGEPPISEWEHSADLTIYLAPIHGALTPQFVKSPLYSREGIGHDTDRCIIITVWLKIFVVENFRNYTVTIYKSIIPIFNTR